MEKMIVETLKRHKTPMTAIELIEGMSESAEEISGALVRMTRDGRLVYTKKGKYALPESLGLIPARAFVLRSGATIARPLDGSEELKLSRTSDLRAMHGDLIQVRREKNRHMFIDKYELVAVSERAYQTVTAVLQMEERKIEHPPVIVRRGRSKKIRRREPEIVRVLAAEPLDRHVVCHIDVEGDLKGAQVGDAVVLKIIDWPRHKTPMRCEVQEVLGDGWDVRVQLKALVEGYRLRREFLEEAVSQAEALPGEVYEEDGEGRLDARDVTLFTIDGEDAKDFDDAVSLDRLEDGAWLLGVHIADVSHYVREHSPIDREARERGTSVYLPGMVLPMLPEALSNHLCSLMPEVDRLAMSLWMTVQGGEVIDVRLQKSVIHSSARLTYAQVNRLFAGEESGIPECLHETLRNMLDLSHTIRRKRELRGSIDFEFPEAQFALDEKGVPTDVFARVRGEAEKLIEDFMLLANECVAKMLRERRLPGLYRIHETPDPDKLHALEIYLNNLNRPTHLGVDPQPVVIREMLEATSDLPESDAIRQMTLRSLKRACYSENPEGHYALALRDYCHFTSPIRRYPDLIVHRQLSLMLSGHIDDARARQKQMPELAAQCSGAEFTAAACERDADDLMKAHYMKKFIGEEFEGTVSGVFSWGFYVALPNTVEGAVHVRTIDDYFEFDEEHQTITVHPGHRVVRLGTKLRVKLEGVNVMAGDIDFSVVWGEIPKKKRVRREE